MFLHVFKMKIQQKNTLDDFSHAILVGTLVEHVYRESGLCNKEIWLYWDEHGNI